MNSPRNEEASEPAGEAPSPRGDELTALERLTYWLTVFLPGFGVLVLVDAATASRIASTATARWLLAVGLFAYSLPLFLALAFAPAVVATGFGATSRYLRSGASSSDYAIDSPGDRTAAFFPAGALFLLVIAEVARFAATAFNNQKLASLLVAVVAIFAVVLAHFIHSASQISLAKVRRSLARHGWVAHVIVWALALTPALLVTAWQLFLNWEGFKILGLGLLGGPILSVAVSTGLRLGWGAPRRLTGRRRAVVWLALPAATVASLSAAAFQEDLPIRAVQAGQWSGKAVKLARRLTDIDGDGASSLFGGGDCAPRDSSIHPLAQDVPGDGIDSNCLEGDAVATTDNQLPAWYDDAPGVGRSRNLVLITIETLRADHLSMLGYPRKTSPQLDALAEKSVVFERTYAASSATHITIPSLFTTLTPSRTKVRRKNKIFGATASMPWIPEILQEEGLRTGAFLVDYFQRNNFQRGFDEFNTFTPVDSSGPEFFGHPSGELVDRVARFIDEAGDERFMVWTHFIEPHAAYEPAKGARRFGDDVLDLYDSDIWEADRQVGRLIKHLESRSLLKSTIVMVTGDHGESFGEHGEKYHYSSVYEPQLRTLGLLYVPGHGGQRVTQPVKHQDISTTAMNLLGVRRQFSRLRGRNLVPSLRGGQTLPLEIFSELAGYGEPVQHFALIDWPYKLIHIHGTQEFQLFDLDADPEELNERGALHPERRAAMRTRMVRHIEGSVGAAE